MELIIDISAGYPGMKEWVQYAASPYRDIKLVGRLDRRAGAAGVSLYPNQMLGLLAAIKGAAEYEGGPGRQISPVPRSRDSTTASAAWPRSSGRTC